MDFYFFEKKNESSNYWICKHPKCKASLTFNHNAQIDKKSKTKQNIKSKDEVELQKDIHQSLTENDITLEGYIKYVMPVFVFRGNKKANLGPYEPSSSDEEISKNENGDDLSSDKEDLMH
ncbi:unnamed protein product [Brachionus calyciflorus]|uniref:FLYWCH-type domain-containing protein n=1 Tax=Brachionus calyciflorus TaxID=104777 RepID=A0A814GYW0_9BILA|nr:unnamed protein product [Brachionus calyciflorus]